MSRTSQPSFLELPLEVRCMIYKEFLPETTVLGRRYYFGIALMQTSKTIHEEMLQMMRKRRLLFLQLKSRESYALFLWWINNLGDELASRIRYLEVESWLETRRGPSAARFQNCKIAFWFWTGPFGYTIRYSLPDFAGEGDLTLQYSSRCLPKRPKLPEYLQQTMLGMLGTAQNITISKTELKVILDAILIHTEYGYLCDPSYQFISRTLQSLLLNPRDHDLQYWTYVYPAIVSSHDGPQSVNIVLKRHIEPNGTSVKLSGIRTQVPRKVRSATAFPPPAL
ncbi:MAG: hypothetical protein L6R39_007273 [Caloplaca ligustica]|nr:MAG: hypothetical protein L6R39_007273 [Caloplaca ligustica]